MPMMEFFEVLLIVRGGGAQPLGHSDLPSLLKNKA